MDSLLSFFLNLFELIAETILPAKVKVWYGKRKKFTKSILKGLLDSVLFLTAAAMLVAIGYLGAWILNLIGIPLR